MSLDCGLWGDAWIQTHSILAERQYSNLSTRGQSIKINFSSFVTIERNCRGSPFNTLWSKFIGSGVSDQMDVIKKTQNHPVYTVVFNPQALSKCSHRAPLQPCFMFQVSSWTKPVTVED